MKQLLINFLKFLLFLSIGLGILYYAYYTQNKDYQATQCFQAHCEPSGIAFEDCNCSEEQLAAFSLKDKLLTDFAGLNYFWIFMAIACFMLSNVSRSIRWNMLMKPLGREVRLQNSFMAVMIGYMANSVIPRSGEIVRCGILSRYERLPVTKVIGTVAVSRSLDVICLATAIGLMVLLQFDVVWGYLSTEVFGGKEDGGMLSNPIFLTLLGLMALGAIGFFIFRKKLLQIPIVKKLWDIAMGFLEGIKTIGKLERPGWFIFHTVAIWFLYYFMHYIAFFSFAPVADMGPMVALTIFVFGSLGIVIPAPGGIGAFQYLVTLALTTFYGLNNADAFSFSNVLFFPIFFTNILAGVIALGLFPVLNKDYKPASLNEPAAAGGEG